MNSERGNSGADVDLFRHSRSGYENYGNRLISDNPQDSTEIRNQITPDLTEDGIKLCENTAEEYFGSLDPSETALFFVSSREARAMSTASIFREVARKQGFEIIKPQHSRSDISEKEAGGEIRGLNALTLSGNNLFANSVFNPEKYLPDINWDSIDEESKKKWLQAREIILSDDKGSWGANFHFHAPKVKNIFHEIGTAEEEYHRTFSKLVKLIKFASSKTEQSKGGKKIKIIGFGHENYLSFALDKYFGEHQINNCEVVRFAEGNGTISASYRGQEQEIK